MFKPKILVIGSGLGGLTLAQSLQRAGIDFQIFERDRSPWERPQGYRLHLDADAINAAAEVLTSPLQALFEATSQHTTPFTTILKTDLSVIKRLMTDDDHGQGVWPVQQGEPIHYNVDRATLRRILLTGLDDAIHFGKKLVRYDQRADRVIAYFEDGSTAEGTVLVGADGIRSAVRSQRAPHARTMDAGLTAIYGRIPIEQARTVVPRETLTDIFTVASDQKKLALGLGSVQFPTPPLDAGTRLVPDAKMQSQTDYVVCIVNGRHEYFPCDLRSASAAELQRVASASLESWPSQAQEIVRAGDPASFFLVEMYTSVPCELDPPSNVTLLGDAIHAMTPTLGRGANLAMRDGVLLGRALKKVAAGQIGLHGALSQYERGMLDYGFAVVREAAVIGQQRVAQNPLPE